MVFSNVHGLLWSSCTLDRGVREREDGVPFLEVLDRRKSLLHEVGVVVRANARSFESLGQSFDLKKVRKFIFKYLSLTFLIKESYYSRRMGIVEKG